MFLSADKRQTKLFAGLAAFAALGLLTACSTDGTSEEPPADQNTEQQTVQPQETQDAADDAGQSAETDQTDDAAAQTSGDDPVYEIIDIVEAEYADGFIVDIDRDDDGGTEFDVDVVVGNVLYELEVHTDGTIRVDEQEDDDDKIRKAGQATVTVTEALDQAFAQHPDTSFDQVDLDDDDGSLHWEIELDGPNGADIDIDIAAK